MTLTDFLNTLTILYDDTTDMTWLSTCGGVLGICSVLMIIGIVVLVFEAFHVNGTDAAVCVKIIIVLGAIAAIGLTVWAARNSFASPFYELKWIISTENTDISSLYRYFEIEPAPIANTVQIIPKGEFYDTISEWYVTHKPLVAPL